MIAFSANDMKVAAVSMPSGVPAIVSFNGAPASLVVSGFGAEMSVNAQFMRSLGNAIYVYPFGDNVGKARLNITAFTNPCSGQAGDAGTLLAYYSSNKLSASDTPVSITMAGAVFSGYLMVLSISGDQSTGVIQGTLDFSVTGSQSSASRSTGGGAGAAAPAAIKETSAILWQPPTILGRVYA